MNDRKGTVSVICPHCKNRTKVKTCQEISLVSADSGERKEQCESCKETFMVSFKKNSG